MDCRNDESVPDPQQIENSIEWDFRISATLCPGLCHRVFIRPPAIVTLCGVHRAEKLAVLCSSWTCAFQACVVVTHTIALVLHPWQHRSNDMWPLCQKKCYN